jgi:hypothetical protein
LDIVASLLELLVDLLQQPYDFEMALSDGLREKRSLRRKVATEFEFHDGRGWQKPQQVALSLFS